MSYLLKCSAQHLYQISGDERFLSFLCSAQIAGQPMQIYAQNGRIECRITLCQQTCDDAGQYVAAAARSHAGIAGSIEKAASFGRSDACKRAFKYDDQAQLYSFFLQ